MKMSPQSFAFLILSTLLLAAAPARAQTGRWNLADPHDVKLGGPLGEAFERSVARLDQAPYRSATYLRSDVSFEMERQYTNYSGDISGRFLEVASLTSPRVRMQPAVLQELIEAIPSYQKSDGHFGIEIDWKKAIEPAGTKKPRMMPLFWGNSRLLVGLITAYEAYGDRRLLDAAKRLGDFYLSTADDLMNPARDAEYRATGTYAPGYVTNYFPGIEGLARLYLLTKDGRCLQQAERMTEFFASYDHLPLDHSHGNLLAYHGIMLLYEITGKKEYLDRAVARWEEAVSQGYIWPIGGPGEGFTPVSHRDEGCAMADWLRLNLDLWRATGRSRYLDMAERLLRNHYEVNRTANGGYGHHEFTTDKTGPLLVKPKFVEAVWCCTFHGLLGLNCLKSHIVAGSEHGVVLNFPFDVAASVRTGGRDCTVDVKVDEDARARAMVCRVRVEPGDGKREFLPLFVRVPTWADGASVTDSAGRSLDSRRENEHLVVTGQSEIVVTFTWSLRAEDRLLHRIALKPGGGQRVPEAVLFAGPRMLFASGDQPHPALTLESDARGTLLLSDSDKLTNWQELDKDAGAAFVFDLTISPRK